MKIDIDTMLNGKDKLSGSALYQENKQLKQQIEKLNEKLSSVYDDTKESLIFARDNLLKLNEENKQLRQQLEEKEKEIIKLKRKLK